MNDRSRENALPRYDAPTASANLDHDNLIECAADPSGRFVRTADIGSRTWLRLKCHDHFMPLHPTMVGCRGFDVAIAELFIKGYLPCRHLPFPISGQCSMDQRRPLCPAEQTFNMSIDAAVQRTAALSAEQTLTIGVVVQPQRMAALSPERTCPDR